MAAIPSSARERKRYISAAKSAGALVALANANATVLVVFGRNQK